MSKEAMKLALEALEGSTDKTLSIRAIKALREALAEQPAQQEPVAWPCVIAEADFEQNTITLEMQCSDYKVGAGQHWLSTFPPQRTWVGLTADDLKEPKNGEQWRVEWWNESCRMMLPADMKLDRSVVWKNGTVQFTIKKSAHGIKENT